MSAREEHIAITRNARLSLLGGTGVVRDVWFACHGYGQLAPRFIRSFEPIAAPDRLIVAPEGLHRFYLDPPPAPASGRRVGATWMTREDREQDIADYVRYLDQVFTHVRPPAGARIRGLGFSQGTATLFRWAAFGHVRFDELILWAGEVPPDVDLKAAAQRLQSTRLILVRGRQDDLVPQHLVDRQRKRLDETGLAHELYEFDGTHELNEELLRQLSQ